MEIVGLFSFTTELLCKQEVLGNHYQTEIAGIPVEIVFPDDPKREHENAMEYIGMGNQLLPPEKGKDLMLGDEKIIWGYPVQYPNLNSFIKYVLMIVECESNAVGEVAQRLYSSIEKWETSFMSFCQLCTKQNLNRNQITSNSTHNLSLLSKEGYIQNQEPTHIQVYLRSEDEYLSDDQVRQAFSFASSGKELLLEYQMLLSSYNAQKEGQNRQAIIDACAAVEVCLVNQIRIFCSEKHIDPELFLRKYRSLGDRFSLIAKIDAQFPFSDYNDVIVKPRNDIAHNRDVYPSNQVARALISAVEQCMKHYHTAYY